MSFAVIQTGGKQYKVSAGDILSVEKISGYKEGDKIVFDKVLLTDDGATTKVGAPYVPGAKVSATIVEEGKGKKKLVVKYRAKSRYFKKNGHRQPFMKVQIESI
jgi:large subunit ribosomal protein L21